MLQPDFTQQDIEIDIKQFLSIEEPKLRLALDYIGLEIVNQARTKTVINRLPKDFFYPHENTGFYDHTGNLRASIGYVVQIDGKIVKDDFQGKSEGKTKGKQKAIENAKQYRGYVLSIVAGMEYAQLVEAKGYDVISSSVLLKGEVEKIIKQLTGLE